MYMYRKLQSLGLKAFSMLESPYPPPNTYRLESKGWSSAIQFYTCTYGQNSLMERFIDPKFISPTQYSVGTKVGAPLYNFTKSAKTTHVGMHFHQKTIPQKPTKQATMHTGRYAQTTHTSQRNAFTAYLPSLHLSNYTHHTLYHPHTQHPSPSTIISILIHTCQHIAIQQPPSHPHHHPTVKWRVSGNRPLKSARYHC